MTKFGKKLRLAVVCSVAFVLALLPAGLAYADADTNNTEQWEVSKSKTATNLDDNFESRVTLSLPSAEEPLATDVVFVLDKSTSADVKNDVTKMLTDLQSQVQNTNAKVKVGVVIFNKEAHSSGFYDLATQYEDIEKAVKQDIHSGTNTHAGLLAGEKMLNDDTSVANSRKYLIFVSDGITYMYNSTPTATAWGFDADGPRYFAGPDNWTSKYGSNKAPDDWNSWLGTIANQYQNQGATYEYSYGQDASQQPNKTDWQDSKNYASSVDIALYKTYTEYQVIAKKYHAYALAAGTGSDAQYTWGPSFMRFLADNKVVTFDQIKNDINYLVDKGSYVDDYMGYVDGDYDFDFVNDASTITLKVGDQTLTAEAAGDNKYGFGKNDDGSYQYILEYVPGDKKADEHFRLTISVPVSNFAPVQLTYSVKLTNPKTAAGTYGTYDEDGSKGYDALYTNSRATLHAVSTEGSSLDEDFGRPTVSYTVEKPDEPTTPEEPSTPTEPTTPTRPSAPAQPAKSTTVKKTNTRPLPATGDPSVNVTGFAIAGAACAIVAVALRCRKVRK